MGFAQRWVQEHRSTGCVSGPWGRLLRGEDAVFPAARQGVGISQAGIGLRVAWIGGDRTLKVFNRCLEAGGIPLVPEIPSLELGLVGLRIHRSCFAQGGLIARAQGREYLPGDSL